MPLPFQDTSDRHRGSRRVAASSYWEAGVGCLNCRRVHLARGPRRHRTVPRGARGLRRRVGRVRRADANRRRLVVTGTIPEAAMSARWLPPSAALTVELHPRIRPRAWSCACRATWSSPSRSICSCDRQHVQGRRSCSSPTPGARTERRRTEQRIPIEVREAGRRLQASMKGPKHATLEAWLAGAEKQGISCPSCKRTIVDPRRRGGDVRSEPVAVRVLRAGRASGGAEVVGEVRDRARRVAAEGGALMPEHLQLEAPRADSHDAATRPGAICGRGSMGADARPEDAAILPRQSGVSAPTAESAAVGGHRDAQPGEGPDVAATPGGAGAAVHDGPAGHARGTGRALHALAGDCATRIPCLQGDARHGARGGGREDARRADVRVARLAAGAQDRARDVERARRGHVAARARPASSSRASTEGGQTMTLSLEEMYMSPAAFAVPATPTQRAICAPSRAGRSASSRPTPACRRVRGRGGDRRAADDAPVEFDLLAGIRTGKSQSPPAGRCTRARRWTSRTWRRARCRASRCSRSTSTRRTWCSTTWSARHRGASRTRGLLLEPPSNRTVLVRHPSGRPIEIACVAGARAGGAVVARWSAGAIFDEFPRMLGGSEGVVNFDDARRAVLGRLLPGRPCWRSASRGRRGSELRKVHRAARQAGPRTTSWCARTRAR